jgi:surface polysaccharide O-acyltransferase-like enzyme
MDRRIDALRVLACFMVLLLHISGANIHSFGPKWWGANFWDSLSRACVPLFFMISGAMLLPKAEPLSQFFKKRASRIILPLIFWSMFYLWWLQHNGVATGNWAVAILSGPTMFHLWYFYAILGLYFFVPILRKFYQNSSFSERMWFISIWFLSSSIYPLIQSLSKTAQCGYFGQGILSDLYHLYYFGGYVGYFVLGAMLAETKGSVKGGFILFSLASVATMLATYLYSKAIGIPCEFFYVYLQPLVVAASIGIFIIFMGWTRGISSKGLRVVSDCTLGIYCLHPFVIDPYFMRYHLLGITGVPWIDPFLAAVGVFLVCLAVIAIARCIKPVRFVT